MKLALFKPLWGHSGSFDDAIVQVCEAQFQGIEGQAPSSKQEATNWRNAMSAADLDFVAEITTAGSYVPDRHATLTEHLSSFERKLLASLELDPLFVTCLGGCDAWPEQQSIDFFGQAMEIASRHDITLSFETHRSRSLFTPWATQRITDALPDMLLTFDFSHWCVVCERLMDTELDTINAIAHRAQHIHARVGYDQGPQVPHPAAPEYATALHSHQQCWEILWQAQHLRGMDTITMTPEFGKDGYLHLAPFTQEPVADLWQINQWMGETERQHFAAYWQSNAPAN